ncbi:Sjogren's syndrome/scleroderma autoantigen 1 family protein, partial [Halobaculum saliterrae]|uniref:Sjogren's syndrome/scleroderma autoantigen 1 family protein n=1 Tax=Halobaculum saliterrae TaxID=2073113 RepID=UPI001F308E0B
MSDTADDDSGFDKEAEREKLQEKFARDERKRESTRRMSELLLKGATMTNSHCDACGSPVFRQNGQEFCPECDGGDGPSGEGAAAAREERGPAADGTDAAAGAAPDPNVDSARASDPAETDRTARAGPTGGSAPADATAADPTRDAAAARDPKDTEARSPADRTRQSGTPQPADATRTVDRAAATTPAD